MTDAMSVSAAIVAWTQDLGRDAVVTDPDTLDSYTRSACDSKREVVAVLRPRSLEHVQRIVVTANTHKVPLYPISCGKQWGMGSRLPVCNGSAIVDLSRMDRIVEVNAEFHYAIVQPGVTQRQLLNYIREHNLPLMLNVTGSSSETSMIGNAMDRGVGYFDSRAHGISDMQIVLGNGSTIQTGFSHYANAKTKNLYPYGVGPSLDGLFLQGSFGIVTSACIDLMPVPDEHMAVIIKIDSAENLPKLVQVLVALRSRGVFSTIAHIGNRERSYITLAPLIYEQLVEFGDAEGEATRKKAVQMLERGGFGPWSAAIGLLGTSNHLKLARKEIRAAFKGFARVMFLNDRLIARAKRIGQMLSFLPAIRSQLMMIKAIEPVYGLTTGEPTDKTLKSVYWAAKDFEHLDAPDPDHTRSGILFCLPIIPASGQSVNEVVRDTLETFAKYGFEAAITINLISDKCMEGVVSLGFNREDPDQTRRANECIQEMEARCMDQGYPPYRVGINSMHHVVQADDPFWQTVSNLKQALDPNNIIAPGRYSIK